MLYRNNCILASLLSSSDLVFSLFIDKKHDYFVCQVAMEYSGGQNLDIYLTRKTLSMDALHSYAQELLEGLQYLHIKDVTHKNLRVSFIV